MTQNRAVVGEAKRPKVVFDGCLRRFSLFIFWWRPAAVLTFSDFWHMPVAVFTFFYFWRMPAAVFTFSDFWRMPAAVFTFLIFDLLFSKTVLVTKRVAVGAFGAFPLRIAVIFHADADFEIKSAVDSYCWPVFFDIFLVRIFVIFLCFFAGWGLAGIIFLCFCLVCV